MKKQSLDNQLDCVIKCSEYKPFEGLAQLYLEPYFLANKAEDRTIYLEPMSKK